MQELFTTLTHAVEGTPAIALGAAFVWGILSIILSPCHLSSIPLIVGFIGEQGKMTARRAFGISSLFAAGILITIALIGLITAAAGRMMGDVGRYGNYIVAVIFFIVGLHLLDVIPMPWSGPGVGMKRKGLLAALILGAHLRSCPWALYVRLYGADAGRDVQTSRYESSVRRAPPSRIRHRPLLGHRTGRHIHGARRALPQLE